ncbi:cell wall-binding repeat-containing protein [Clostridium sp. WILCCON 0269]|uniref:Cell wall-binding repeat-containing protein n=1 Tax=Candidatus Clostridium eludens TaxID=3381663 RepID=A0ABW8SEG5_9CLOT
MISLKQKVLIIIMTSVLTLGAISIVNADTVKTRISGGWRNDTTATLISQAGWTQSDTVIIVSGSDFPDALCAGPLAKKLNAPILMTGSYASCYLGSATLTEIERLNATKAIIIGGTGVISDSIKEELGNAGVSAERIGGADRYETSVLIAQKLDKSPSIVVTSGDNFPDALSISSIAAQQGMPIILSSKNGLFPEAESYISSNEITKTYIVGGTGALDGSIESEVPNPTRLAGKDRYETNLAVLNQFRSNLKFNKVYIATGNDFSDALVGSVLAAKTQSPVILVDTDLTDSLAKYIVENKTSSTNVIVIGNLRNVNDRVFDEAQGVAVDRQPLTTDLMADEIIDEVIKPGMSDFEKELALHDYIIENATYNYGDNGLHSVGDTDPSDTAESVLLKGEGGDNGVTEAMNLLLDKVGIESQIVTGRIKDGVVWRDDYKWSMVKINGDYYQLDVYSDLTNTNGSFDVTPDHTYFNVTDEFLSNDHSWSSSYPKCTVKYELSEQPKVENNSTETDNNAENNDGNKTNEPTYYPSDPSDNTPGMTIPPSL